MIAFIDDHRGEHGVEPICRVLPIASSTYHARVAQRADPTLGSARSQRDAMLDRVLHHAHVVTIQGESYRLKDKRRAGLVARPAAKAAN